MERRKPGVTVVNKAWSCYHIIYLLHLNFIFILSHCVTRIQVSGTEIKVKQLYKMPATWAVYVLCSSHIYGALCAKLRGAKKLTILISRTRPPTSMTRQTFFENRKCRPCKSQNRIANLKFANLPSGSTTGRVNRLQAWRYLIIFPTTYANGDMSGTSSGCNQGGSQDHNTLFWIK